MLWPFSGGWGDQAVPAEALPSDRQTIICHVSPASWMQWAYQLCVEGQEGGGHTPNWESSREGQRRLMGRMDGPDECLPALSCPVPLSPHLHQRWPHVPLKGRLKPQKGSSHSFLP